MRAAPALLLAACAASAPARRAEPVVFAAAGATLVPLACGAGQEIERRGCLARVPAGARVRTATGDEVVVGPRTAPPCGAEAALELRAAAAAFAVWPADAPVLGPQPGPVAEDEGVRIHDQLARTDPSLTASPVIVRQVLRADLDGDGAEDATFVAALGPLDALLMAASSTPARLRILQFSDSERYELLGAVNLDPARPGRQLVLRTLSPAATEVQVLRATGETVGDLRCLTSP